MSDETHRGSKTTVAGAVLAGVLLVTSSTGCWRPQASAGPAALPSSHRGLPGGSRADYGIAGAALSVTMDGPSAGSVSLVGTSTDASGQSSYSEIDVGRSVDDVVRPRVGPPSATEEQRGYMDALVPGDRRDRERLDDAERAPPIDGHLPAQ